MEHFDYIEIGTADFDTIVQEAGSVGLRGLSVDPVRYYLERLPDVEGNSKVCVAIGKQRKMVEAVYLDPAWIETEGLPGWLKGCTCLDAPHPLAWKEAQHRGKGDEVFIREPVEQLTFPDLIERYQVKSLDRLKIDAEGMDIEIMESFLDLCSKRPELLAKEIQFEIAHSRRLGLESRLYAVRVKLARRHRFSTFQQSENLTFLGRG